MKLSQFDFKLASTRTAIHPSENRDESRLMVVHKKTGKIEHKQFKDIIKYFKEDDVLVLNDTKVFPARLYGQKEKTGAKIEVFLLRELNPELNLWDVLVDPARKIRVGNKLYFGDGELVAEVIDNTTSRGTTIRFIPEDSEKNFYDIIHEFGETPLPKEIKRKVDKKDENIEHLFGDPRVPMITDLLTQTQIRHNEPKSLRVLNFKKEGKNVVKLHSK
mgnify:CR=1 FL=1